MLFIIYTITDIFSQQKLLSFWITKYNNLNLPGYVWLDQYEISQGDNRRVIKLMEKENNKIRQKARKERNEEIRRLVSFVRRKDKRVIEHTKQLQEKAEENKRKVKYYQLLLIIFCLYWYQNSENTNLFYYFLKRTI